ncbi:spore germination protein GerPB [Peribacillus asahii]|uniref:spore germination protein GerPB n=1 Tax=Peribacillus asahii TaxID=228899 RepID=UPI0038215C5F
MIFHIQQTIQINMIKIGGISNSSVFQIGSAGIIKPYSSLANTGGFTEPAPQLKPSGEISLVPL